jgi:CRP/FNR family transcriptional regulator, anaerobic regulatory protein
MAFTSNIFESKLIEEINEVGTEMSFAEGDTIIEYGKYIHMIPLIQTGVIKVMRRDEEGRELLLYYLSGNSTCSMAYSCCMESRQSEIQAIAEEDVTLLAIPHAKLDEWLCKYPSWKSFIMHSFNERLLEMLKTIENIAFKKLDERLIDYLKEKQRINHSAVIKASHNTIAEEMGTSRVVISRLLKHLENDKKIILYRNELRIMKEL